jgi:hypothetical protein
MTRQKSQAEGGPFHGQEDRACHRHRSGLRRFQRVPGYSLELLRNHIDAQIERLRSQGYDAESCLIDLGDTAEAVVAKALRSKQADCVVIGAGLRQPPERLHLFETVLNLVHALAPNARICFNTNPADTAEAVQRWIEP